MARASRSKRSLNCSAQILDGDGAGEARVAGLVDFAHATGADRGQDLVGAESGAGREGHEIEVFILLDRRSHFAQLQEHDCCGWPHLGLALNQLQGLESELLVERDRPWLSTAVGSAIAYRKTAR